MGFNTANNKNLHLALVFTEQQTSNSILKNYKENKINIQYTKHNTFP